MKRKLFPFLIAALALLGCADPMMGRWQSREDPEIDLDVREGNAYVEYVAHGHIYLCTISKCGFCGVNFQFKDAGTDHYELQGHGDDDCFTKAAFSGVYCTLTEDDAALDCHLREGESILYEKVDD